MWNYQKNFIMKNFKNKINGTNINTSYKNIVRINNDKLGHLITEIKNNPDIYNNKNILRICSSERKKHKYITFIYYRPI